jgi:hypothetical protein
MWTTAPSLVSRDITNRNASSAVKAVLYYGVRWHTGQTKA